MSMTYSFGQAIPTAGLTGPIFNALHNNTAAAITVSATPIRNQDNDAVSLSVPAGGILPIKVRQVKPQSTGIIGLS